MALVEITCPHCQSIQKVPEHRIAQSTMCMKCQQVIDEPFMHKVAPPEMQLNVALKGKLVTDFGTTQLDEVEATSAAYTGKGEEAAIKDDLQALDVTRSFSSGAASYLPPERKAALSTAARTYLVGGAIIAVVLTVATVIALSLIEPETETKDISSAVGNERIERYASGAVQSRWTITKLPSGEEVMHGTWEEFYETGKKKGLGQYHEGRQAGTWTTWYIDGSVESKGEYVDGAKQGAWEEFHPNGVRAAVANWLDGKPDGEARRWYRDKQAESVSRFKNGQPDGDWAAWHENGELKFSNTYKDGRKVGTWRRFFDNGIQEFEESYVQGLPEGPTWGAYRSRQKAFEGAWSGGLQVGRWTWWHPNGAKARSGEYIEGRQDGTWEEWHDNNKLRLRETFVTGTREGLREEFWPDGSLRSRREFASGVGGPETLYYAEAVVLPRSASKPSKAEWTVLAENPDVRHGQYRSYHPDESTVAEEGDYLMGKKQGIWRYYNAQGQLSTQKRYVDGLEVD